MSDVATLSPPSIAAPHVARLRFREVLLMVVVATAMCLATAFDAWSLVWSTSITWIETIGFVTGGICVWLVVREHVWNWPLGIANNIAFFVLFTQSSLYADAGLQIVYLALAVYGWWNWLRGGEKRTQLTITRAPRRELIVLFILAWPATLGLQALLIEVNGAAPFWDAISTVLSLVAQFLLCRKRFENWYVWMLVDVIYIPLYISRDLPLTAILYFVLLLMCIAGWWEWRKTLRSRQTGARS